MNQAQRTLLDQEGVKSPADLPIMRRLDYANFGDIADPEPIGGEKAPVQGASGPTEAQRQYLDGRTLADLEPWQLDIYNRFGTDENTTAARADGTVTPVVNTAPAKNGDIQLDPAKISALSPTFKLDLVEAIATLNRERNAVMRNVDVRLRESRIEIDRARQLVTPFLA